MHARCENPGRALGFFERGEYAFDAIAIRNLFVAGLNTGVAFSHAQQAPQKAKLDRKSLVDVSGSCICDMGRPPRFLSLARLRPL